jgi:hypothetical protein
MPTMKTMIVQRGIRVGRMVNGVHTIIHPPIGKPFAFTTEELDDLAAIGRGHVRHPRNETADEFALPAGPGVGEELPLQGRIADVKSVTGERQDETVQQSPRDKTVLSPGGRAVIRTVATKTVDAGRTANADTDGL